MITKFIFSNAYQRYLNARVSELTAARRWAGEPEEWADKPDDFIVNGPYKPTYPSIGGNCPGGDG